MKHLLLALLLASFSSALADTPARIAEDYRKAAATALTKVNGMLETATTPLIAKLVTSGDTAAAEQLTSQLKAKLAGEPVPTPHASATLLFAQYDQARAKALEPAQKTSISRIDGMLKSTSKPSLETVTELGKVRAEINGGTLAARGGDDSKSVMHSSWDYYSDPSMSVINGQFIWNPDGTVELKGTKYNSTPGRWEATNDPHLFKVIFTLANKTEEKCELRVRGDEAELVRPIGTRYLKAR